MKLGLTKNFVKALDKSGAGYLYLHGKFQMSAHRLEELRLMRILKGN
jgi:hypothetical protein